MCGSLTLIPQKGNLFVFQVIFFDEKRGEYECIAVRSQIGAVTF